ncbi:hypothetical protein BJ165DRAFT_997436 [Panaeolus papilionaceus]|nr:hypothetical protein BJ165DRAFT_997436 [Panaeolus papilionaceus]
MSTHELSTQPAYILDIPQELLNAIIDLNKDDTKTLLNCALVCHRFTARCQEQIFNKISLNSIHGPRIAMQLQDVFTKSSHLAHFVHKLMLIGNRYENPSHDHSWLCTSKAVVVVLSQLIHVQEFVLRSNIGMKLQWKKFPEALQSALESFIKNGSVCRLGLYSVEEFPCRLFSIPSLTHLTLMRSTINLEGHDVAPSPVSEPIPALPSQPSHLKYLYFHSYLDFFNFIPFLISPKSGVDVSDIRHLTIRPAPSRGLDAHSNTIGMADWWDLVIELVQKVSHGLRELWISPEITLKDQPGLWTKWTFLLM